MAYRTIYTNSLQKCMYNKVNLIVMSLQTAYTYGSAEMVGNMINSDRTFTYKVGAADCGTFTVPDGKGGSISTIAQGKGIHKNDAIASVVHETMHNAQFMHDQGGQFVANEVEAYTFQNVVGQNRTLNQTDIDKPSATMYDAFGHIVNDLSWGGYSMSNFITGMKLFKGSSCNNSRIYDSYKAYFPLGWKPLLKLYNIKIY